MWKAAERPYSFDDDAHTWVGVDVSQSFDHTAIVWGQIRPDGRLHAKCRVFAPTKDATIDLEEVSEYIRQLCARYDVQEVAYDPAYFHTAPLLARDLPMVEVKQTRQRMVRSSARATWRSERAGSHTTRTTSSPRT